MARKFGNKVQVSDNINDYMLGIMGPSGYGKTTLMYQVCDKLFGDDGYLLLDMGAEDGVAAIDGVVAEKTPTWKKVKEVVDDIVKNKDTDWADLKVVIFDTLDAAFEIAEEYTIKAWNQENMGEQGFRPATSINSVESGYGRGLDRVIDTVKKEINRLSKVGVKVWWTAHVKEKDQVDLFTGNAYTTLTANMSMKYFNSIKNISHVIGFGYLDRTVEKQEVGEANPITKKKKTRNAVLDESRKMKFRDSTMIADAKSRFTHITEEITLDRDEFIKAIQDAIAAEHKGAPTVKKATPKPAPVEEPEDDEIIDDIDDEVEFDVEAARAVVKDKYKHGTAEEKAEVKTILDGAKLATIDDEDTLKALLNVFE